MKERLLRIKNNKKMPLILAFAFRFFLHWESVSAMRFILLAISVFCILICITSMHRFYGIHE